MIAYWELHPACPSTAPHRFCSCIHFTHMLHTSRDRAPRPAVYCGRPVAPSRGKHRRTTNNASSRRHRSSVRTLLHIGAQTHVPTRHGCPRKSPRWSPHACFTSTKQRGARARARACGTARQAVFHTSSLMPSLIDLPISWRPRLLPPAFSSCASRSSTDVSSE